MHVVTIVIVDDDIDVQDLLELAFSLKGFHVIACNHGAEAFGIIRDIKPNLVMLDLQTPNDRQAGLTILAKLRSDPITNTIPVFLMTADHSALHQHTTRLLELHATPLKKPFDMDQLFNMINQATDK